MRDWIGRLLALPQFDDEEKTRQAQLAFSLALLFGVVPALYALYRLVSAQGAVAVTVYVPPLAFSVVNLFLIFLIRRGHVKIASVLLVLATWVSIAVMSWFLGGVRDPSYAVLSLVVILAGLLLSSRAAIVVVVANLALGWVLAEGEIEGALPTDFDAPFEVLATYAVITLFAWGLVAASSLGFTRLMKRSQEDERTLRARNWELQQMRDSLERRVAERTEDLDRRSRYLEAAASVAYSAGELLDPEEMMRASVELIQEAFGLYYVGLFEVERAPAGEAAWVVLRAGTGEAGRRMLARNHRIRIGEGMVGWCVAQAQSRFAQHAEEDAVRLVASELPETRAEAALPLRVRGRVLGALSVQSVQPDFFDAATVTVLQTMADLLAIAMDNAALLEQSEQALAAVRRAYGEISAQAWDDLLQERGAWGYAYAEGSVRPVRTARDVTSWGPATLAATETHELAVHEDADGSAVALPLRSSGSTIGAISFRRDAADGDWGPEDVTMLTAVADQLSQALDSARLLQESRRQAMREQQINDVVAAAASAVDVETMLRAAAKALGGLPGVLEASVHLGTAGMPAPTAGMPAPAAGDSAATESARGNGGGQHQDGDTHG